MNGENIMDAIGELPEDLLAPVAELRKKKPVHWTRWASLAAACLLILMISLSLPLLRAENRESAKDFINSEQEMMPEVAETVASAHSFRATVLEVDDRCILVRPLEGEQELRSADKIYASFRNLKEVPKIEVGDIVEITYSGMIQETYPASAADVTDIRVIQ